MSRDHELPPPKVSSLTLNKRLSDPCEFRYSKELLCKMNIKELGSLLSCLLPITKLTSMRYMFGTEAKMIIVKKESVMIRTGGGYCSLEEHLLKYALVECLIIWRAM